MRKREQTIILLVMCFTMTFTACSTSNIGGKTPTQIASENAETAEMTSPDDSNQPASDYVNVPADVAELFSTQDGWQVTDCYSVTDATIPETLMTTVEDSPMQFYWIRAVVLSSNCGYDLKNQLGNQVTIEVYRVIGGEIPTTFNDSTFSEPRGIIIRSNNGIIAGAFIDTRVGNAYTLTLKKFDEVTGQSLADYWYSNYYDKADSVNKAAEKRSAEEVIPRYFDGVASENNKELFSTLCLQQKIDSLYINMDANQPYNKILELYHYLTAADVLSINPYPAADTNELKIYDVLIEAKLSEAGKQVLGQDGQLTRFLSIGKENGRLCVFGDGTGP